VVEQKGESVVDWLSRDEVIVVEDEDKSLRHGGNLVDQSGQDRVDAWWLGRLECCPGRLSDTGLAEAWDGLQGADQVGPKARRIIVALVEREPGDVRTRLAAGDPLADQRGLAKAGRGRDEGEFALEALIQSLDQARARDPLRVWPGGGDIEFGVQ
jgi:hypothetical protein